MWPFNRDKESDPAAAVAKKVHKRAYKSAQSSNITFGWATAASKPDYDIKTGLRALRARSREQYQNNDIARKIVAMHRNNVVGSKGISMQSRAKFIETGEPDRIASGIIESAWKDWGRKEHCDVRGLRSFKTLQDLVITTALIDGEVIVNKVSGGKYGLQLEMIDAELLDVEYNRDVAQGSNNYIRMGIEYSSLGRPVAYHIKSSSRNKDWYEYNSTSYRRIRAENILHIYRHEFVDQSRGVPWMSTALHSMKMLDGYVEAAVVAARAGASKMGFYYSEDGAEYHGDGVDGDGNLISEAEPGMFEELPPGTKFQGYDPTYPHQQFPEFTKAINRRIASSMGISYNALANDLQSVSFSSMRSGALEERENWKELQDWMASEFCAPVFEAWLDTAILGGALSSGSIVLSAGKIDKYRDVSWQAKRWSWVDPIKDVQSNILAINNGLRSRSDIIREMGRDPDEVWSEIVSENDLLESLGVKIVPDVGVIEDDEDEAAVVEDKPNGSTDNEG